MNSRKIIDIEREIDVISLNILRNLDLYEQGEILIDQTKYEKFDLQQYLDTV